MTQQEFIKNLEEILEANEGSIQVDQLIADLENWDSLAVMSFIAMVDDKTGITLEGKAIAKAIKVSDLMALLGSQITE